MIGCMNDYVFIDYLSHHEIRVICYKNDQYQMKAVFGSKQDAETFAKHWLDFKSCVPRKHLQADSTAKN